MLALQSYYTPALDRSFSGIFWATADSTRGVYQGLSFLGEGLSWEDVIDPINLTTVSSLIRKVDPPKDSFTTTDIDLGVFKLTFPEAIQLSKFSVTFLETDSFPILRWYENWRDALVSKEGIFSALKYRTLSFSLIHNNTLGLPSKIDVYPAVFPVDYSESGVDANSTDLKKITITFARLISFSGTTSDVSRGLSSVMSPF